MRIDRPGLEFVEEAQRVRFLVQRREHELVSDVRMMKEVAAEAVVRGEEADALDVRRKTVPWPKASAREVEEDLDLLTRRQRRCSVRRASTCRGRARPR